MPEEQPVFYNTAARQRIDASVKAFEGDARDVVGRMLGRAAMWVFQIKLGKADADIAKGASGTVSEYKGTTPGSESDTGTNFTVFCRLGAVSSGKWVIFFRWFGHWEALGAEC